MLKKLSHIILCFFILESVHAQTDFGNEWIKDFSKKYYKIQVGKDGLYRIGYDVLKKLGLENTNADHFQLWNNGVEVPMYTTQSNTTLNPDGFLEFFGKMNDGKLDTKMYQNPKYQTSDKWSLLTDTAVYFLTTNQSSVNLRYAVKTNSSSTSNLTPEEYFNYTYRYAFKDQINPGSPNVIAGVNVYSSSFDEGEGWTSRGITSSNALKLTISNLQVSSSGPDASMRLNFFGGSLNTRQVSVQIAGNSVINSFPLAGFSSKDTTVQIVKTKLAGSFTMDIINASSSVYDQYMVGQLEINYPRKFDFGGAANFEFSIEPSSSDKLIEITSFKFGSNASILYDLTNQQRYVAEIKGNNLRFLVPANSQKRNFVLMSVDVDELNTVGAIVEHKFIDFSNLSNQGDYIIITDSMLRKSKAGDAIENYKQYRSGAAGGNFNVLVADVSQITDQFAYGIKKHPLGIKKFIQFATVFFKPKDILLIGKGVTYDQFRINESSVYANKLNLVPTFGSPASDHILASNELGPIAQIPIGRLSVINGDELNAYLEKLKQHEDLMSTGSSYQTVDKKGWTKNVLHLVAGGVVQPVVTGYMNDAAKKIKDTLFGAKVTSIEKTTAASVESGNNTQIDQMFENGLGIVNYFGHSSLNSMEFNLDDPARFNNPGKYPLFLANACTAGNNFFYDTLRILSNKKSISEAYILEPQKGSIAFVASTHYGILMNLNDFVQRFYDRLGKLDYDKTLGEIHQRTMTSLQKDFGNSPNNLTTMEQILLHGDPATKLYPHPKSDYVIEDPLITVAPQPLTIAESYYDVKVVVRNIGLARNDSVKVTVKRDRPDGSSEILSSKLMALNYGDSIQLKFLLDPKKDLGQQTIAVTVDPDNLIDEVSESNNTVTKKINVLDNDIKPVFPTDFAIVNKWPVKLSASIGNFSASGAQYVFQVDTTSNFNSPILDSTLVSSNGGLIEYLPNIRIADSTVLFWRVAKKPSAGISYNWFSSSLVYISKSEEGWNQSSYYQFLKNQVTNFEFDQSRNLNFSKKNLTLYVQSKLKSTTTSYNSVEVGNNVVYNQSCDAAFGTLEFSLITKRTGKPIKNTTPPAVSKFSSFVPAACFLNTDLYQYWFNYNSQQGRNDAANFFNYVPNGTLLVLNHWNKKEDNTLKTVDQWNKDALYNKLISVGFTLIDSFKSNLPFSLVAYKNDLGEWSLLQQKIGKSSSDELSVEQAFEAIETSGKMSFPIIGPAKNWKSISLNMKSLESPTDDNSTLEITGVDNNLRETQLYLGSIVKSAMLFSKDTTLSFIDASKYPWIKFTLYQNDATKQTPSQIKYLQVKYEHVPEGALGDVANTTLISSMDKGSNYQFQASFKNISNTAFDSVKVVWKITDDKNRDSILFDGLKKKLNSGDTIQFSRTLDTRKLSVNNLISLSVNPQNAQPEQFMFNNYLQTKLRLIEDAIPPILDVTFDGVHILNRDIVSSKPQILIELKDDNAFLPLNDTALFNIRLRYPDGIIRQIRFDGDTLKFSPSSNPPGGNNNTAVINFKPLLRMDGEYELLITAKDRSDNASGATDFSVLFQVVNQSMITNLLNYPNPFTTSTAFVFTLTGSELPTYMRIQILTITGKIVKEISMAELGPLRIGNNITEYKWDGRDQYGQLLANGVYLYRVITDIKGKKIDKLSAGSYNTDQYFKAGYGKMYLMR